MERVFACDPGKRARILKERGFDLLAMAEVFAGQRRLDFADNRFNYGEERRVTIGKANEFVFTVIYTMRGPVTWLIAAWPSNSKERQYYEGR